MNAELNANQITALVLLATYANENGQYSTLTHGQVHETSLKALVKRGYVEKVETYVFQLSALGRSELRKNTAMLERRWAVRVDSAVRNLAHAHEQLRRANAEQDFVNAPYGNPYRCMKDGV